MPAFFHYSRLTLIALFLLCFTFTAVYVPQIHKVPQAHAITVQETGPSLINQIWTRIQTTISTGYQYITSTLANKTWIKEFLLDKLAWNLAKNAISMMTRSIVRWINSGFQGSPAFIQDLGGFLTNVADETMGQFIQGMGGPLSIICSPFRLNVQIAVATAYNRTRDKGARRCTLSGSMQNIQNFVNGDMSQGGWSSWLQIVHQPQTYSPYGAALEASMEASITLRNAQGQQLNILNWGSGFLSNVFCNTTSAPAQGPMPDGSVVPTPAADCPITTPGRVIADQLNHSLGLGADSLVAADEINEILGALLNQVVSQAISGANGLLGLSGSGRYSNPSFNIDMYTAGMEIQNDPTATRKLLLDGITTEVAYAQLAKQVIDRYESSYNTDPVKQAAADTAYNEAQAALPQAQKNALELQRILALFDSAATTKTGDPTGAKDVAAQEKIRQDALNAYMLISSTITDEAKLDGTRKNWEFALSSMVLRDDGYVDRRTLADALERENYLLEVIEKATDRYELIQNPTAKVKDTYTAVSKELLVVQDNIIDLQKISLRFENADTATEREEALASYGSIKEDLHTDNEINELVRDWETVFGSFADDLGGTN